MFHIEHLLKFSIAPYPGFSDARIPGLASGANHNSRTPSSNSSLVHDPQRRELLCSDNFWFSGVPRQLRFIGELSAVFLAVVVGVPGGPDSGGMGRSAPDSPGGVDSASLLGVEAVPDQRRNVLVGVSFFVAHALVSGLWRWECGGVRTTKCQQVIRAYVITGRWPGHSRTSCPAPRRQTRRARSLFCAACTLFVTLPAHA